MTLKKKTKENKKMKTRSNMPLYVVECSNVKALTDDQINLLRCGDYLVKKDASGEHAYKVTFKSATGMCITYHDASVIETQSYDLVNGHWQYNSEDKTELVGDREIEDDITFTGNVSFNNTMSVAGDASFTGEVYFDDAYVTGVTRLYRHLVNVSDGNTMCEFGVVTNNGDTTISLNDLKQGLNVCDFTGDNFILKLGNDTIDDAWLFSPYIIIFDNNTNKIIATLNGSGSNTIECEVEFSGQVEVNDIIISL